MSYLSDCTRVYVRTGQIAHLLPPGELPSIGMEALCGQRPCVGSPWLGTGAQHEHEKAARLRDCPRCKQKAAGR